MTRPSRATLGIALLAGVVLAGCGGSHRQAVSGPVTASVAKVVAPTLDSAPTRSSVRRVKRAFASQNVELRNVTPKDFRGLLAFLDGRPSHALYIYVILQGCKCTLNPPIRNATLTRYGNVEVVWRGEKSTVRSALRALH